MFLKDKEEIKTKKVKMKKLLLGLLLSVFSFQQISAQKIQIGIGFGYDMGVNFENNQDYKVNLPEFGKTTSLISMDLFTKIPIKNGFNIYPTVIFTILKGLISIENLNGDFMPEGYTVSLPYSTVGNGWAVSHYSDDYEYFLSDGYISQTSFGGFVTKNITENFEIGSGLFYKLKKYSIDNFKAYDEYIWESSTGTQYDNYSYVETHGSPTPFKTDIIKTSQISVPILLQYNFDFNNRFMGFSFLTYISKDTYFCLQMTLGLNIENKHSKRL